MRGLLVLLKPLVMISLTDILVTKCLVKILNNNLDAAISVRVRETC